MNIFEFSKINMQDLAALHKQASKDFHKQQVQSQQKAQMIPTDNGKSIVETTPQEYIEFLNEVEKLLKKSNIKRVKSLNEIESLYDTSNVLQSVSAKELDELYDTKRFPKLEWPQPKQKALTQDPIVSQQSQLIQQQNDDANEAKRYLERMMREAQEAIDPYTAKVSSGTVESHTEQSVDILIDASSRDVRRILNDQNLFNQELRNPASVIYSVLAVDLLELNLKKRNLNNLYSQDINEYYDLKLNRKLFDSTNDDHNAVMQVINDKQFQQYYEYGCQAQSIQGSFNLEIESDLLEKCAGILYDDQYAHKFDLKRTDICLSVNTYGRKDFNYEAQRQNPLIRKTQYVLDQTSDPDITSKNSFDALKKLKLR